MKLLLTATALAMLLVAPVSARSQSYPAAARSTSQGASAPQLAVEVEGDNAYASYASYGDVIENGEFVGRDPDPNVRLMLRRDQAGEQNDGGAD